jgi:hypothetical protein
MFCPIPNTANPRAVTVANVQVLRRCMREILFYRSIDEATALRGSNAEHGQADTIPEYDAWNLLVKQHG